MGLIRDPVPAAAAAAVTAWGANEYREMMSFVKAAAEGGWDDIDDNLSIYLSMFIQRISVVGHDIIWHQ
jgi:hypothetical protein